MSGNNTSTETDPSERQGDRSSTAKGGLAPSPLMLGDRLIHPQEQALFEEAEASLLKERDAKQSANEIQQKSGIGAGNHCLI